MVKYVTFDSDCCPQCTPSLHVTALLFIGFLPGLFCVCCASWKWLVVFSVALSSPRLLWQPGSGHPAEGARYVYALGLYWNMVMAICFASPLLILCCCWNQPILIFPTLLYILWGRVIARAELKDGAAWPWFSQQEWGYHAFRRYLRLRIHVHPLLQEYPPEKPVVIAVHPHGVASDYRILLDGMFYNALPKREVLTLSASVLFCIPMVRELALWTRCIDARKSVAARALKKKHSLMVIPGGEQEQIRTVQGREEVFLRKRFGFIKLALEQQAAVVPCYAFGCVDLYATYTNFLFSPREYLRKTLGVCIPVYLGALGFLPLRKPVHLVCGAPLELSCKVPGKPTDEEVQSAHCTYMDALKNLYDEERHQFGYPERELTID
ncbi:Diacylglycerol O-acyltransferase 1 (Diglyceride acyltransferase) (Triacylglycerol synthase) (TAG synthase) [Durusdinium trenchii]|uniref:Acyltransferase n=1 Tax=Durusdinium trenchii TaxID=1381693 RepID=A0ABP0HP27_9DINO